MYKHYQPVASTKPVMYEILDEKTFLSLRFSETRSVSVMGLLPNLSAEKHAQLMVIEEFKKFDQVTKTKLPGGGMEAKDASVKKALAREILEETGYVAEPEDMEFCFAAEFSSTVKGETSHVKGFLLVKKFTLSGKPTKKDPGKLSWSNVKGIDSVIIRNHHCCLKNGVKLLMNMRVEFALDLMNYKPVERFEGRKMKP